MNLIQIAMQSKVEIDKILDGKLKDDFFVILDFLESHVELTPKLLKGKETSTQLMQVFALKYKMSRLQEAKKTKKISTKIDPVVELIYGKHISSKEYQVRQALEAHQVLMSIENRVGNFLESYIHSVIYEGGWVWCSGSSVRHVDFIQKNNGAWRSLQIKNRDNSENSASSLVRSGTPIEKWHRFYSRSGETNWQNFPDVKMRDKLSEQGFYKFVLSHDL